MEEAEPWGFPARRIAEPTSQPRSRQRPATNCMPRTSKIRSSVRKVGFAGVPLLEIPRSRLLRVTTAIPARNATCSCESPNDCLAFRSVVARWALARWSSRCPECSATSLLCISSQYRRSPVRSRPHLLRPSKPWPQPVPTSWTAPAAILRSPRQRW